MTTPTNTRSQGGAEPGPADAVARLPFAIMDDELSALHRFYETTEDGQDYDVPVPMMKRLAVIGLVRRVTGNRYEFTDFGLSVRNGDFAEVADQHALAAPASAQEAAALLPGEDQMREGFREYDWEVRWAKNQTPWQLWRDGACWANRFVIAASPSGAVQQVKAPRNLVAGSEVVSKPGAAIKVTRLILTEEGRAALASAQPKTGKDGTR